MNHSLFESCIDGRFILKTSEPQKIDTFLNDGSHHYPSGLNLENGLGVITDADNMLPFAYDVKSANGVQLADNMVQVRNPTLCFEQSPFRSIEPSFAMERNIDVLQSLQTYPDGSLINPTALTMRQTDSQVYQNPVAQLMFLQNQISADISTKLALSGYLEKFLEQKAKQEAETEIIQEPEEGALAPAEPLEGEHQRTPEHIHMRHSDMVEKEEQKQSREQRMNILRSLTKKQLIQLARNRLNMIIPQSVNKEQIRMLITEQSIQMGIDL